ncbi:MAG: hypothetical protein R6X15_10865 [Pseudomonadota bacterium]
MISPLVKLSTIAMGCTLLALQGCAQQNDRKEVVQNINNDDYYEVEHEGRLYVFDDAITYKSFLEIGETSYRKVRIAAGPNGETIVFGLTSEDKKKSSGIASIDMYDGKLAGGEPFYGEVHYEGRIYVFDNWEDLQSFKQVGEAPYRYTMIGEGPKGETVVIVLNKDNKKEHPEAQISAFKSMHSQS